VEHELGRDQLRRRCSGWIGMLLLLTAIGPGCGGSKAGGSPDGGGNPGPGIVRVDVTPGAILLGAAGQTHALTAHAFNAQNVEVATTFTWTSSHPDQVSVDSTGKLTGTTIGSAQITAAAGGVTSAATTVLVAETAPGAVMVTDAQVVSVGPVTFTPDEEPGGVGTQYEVRLKGVSPVPSPGTILLASESAQVAGKVVSTRDESGTLVATLELRPLYEVLARYSIDLDLEVAPYAPDLLAPPAARSAGAAALSTALGNRSPADTALQQFNTVDCDATVDAKLASKKISLGPTSSLRWVVQETQEDPNQGPTHVKHTLQGQFALVGSVEIAFNPQVSVDATCKFTLPPIRIAALGMLSVLVMPAIRLGVGLDLHAALQVASATVGLTGTVGFQADLGWECGPGPCQQIMTLSEIDDVKPKLQSTDTNGIQVDVSGRLYAFAGLDLAILGGLGGYFGIVEAQIGPKQSAKLASEDSQAELPNSSSSYQLDLEGSIEPGAGLKAAIKRVINDDAVSVDLKGTVTKPLSTSPRGTMNVSKTQAAVGDPVKFTVDIDPNSASYLGIGYNIVSIEFYRMKLGDPEFTSFPDLEIFPSASNQTHFEKNWTPRSSDIGMYQFAAFVHTEVHDTGLLPLLEIADDTRKQVEVQGICAPSAIASRAASFRTTGPQQQQSSSCQVDGTVHATSVIDSPGASHFEYTRDATVTFDQQFVTPVNVQFVPKGTCTMSWHGTAAVTGGTCDESGTLVSCEIDTSGSFLTMEIDNSTDPPTYTYFSEINANVKLHIKEVCPYGTTEFDNTTNEILLEIPSDDARQVGADGSVTGTRTQVLTPTGTTKTDTWTWDLKLEVPPPPPGP